MSEKLKTSDFIDAKVWFKESLGEKYCFLHEFWHRDEKEGPALIHINGSRAWYFEGKLHRLNGPAVENADGTQEYWINGKLTSQQHHKLFVDLMNLKGLL